MFGLNSNVRAGSFLRMYVVDGKHYVDAAILSTQDPTSGMRLVIPREEIVQGAVSRPVLLNSGMTGDELYLAADWRNEELDELSLDFTHAQAIHRGEAGKAEALFSKDGVHRNGGRYAYPDAELFTELEKWHIAWCLSFLRVAAPLASSDYHAACKAGEAAQADFEKANPKPE